eukprot:COSAG04_NODE_12787_length_635_cov_0.966418_1_plen_141_part_00
MCALDPQRIGNRGSHRYSFGGAVGALGEEAAWSVLVDPPALMPVMAAIFGTEDFTCDGVGGGDFVLPGATDFQHLHSVSAALLLPGLSSANPQELALLHLGAGRLRAAGRQVPRRQARPPSRRLHILGRSRHGGGRGLQL